MDKRTCIGWTITHIVIFVFDHRVPFCANTITSKLITFPNAHTKETHRSISYYVEYCSYSTWVWRIFHIILSVPHNTAIDMNNVLTPLLLQTLLVSIPHPPKHYFTLTISYLHHHFHPKQPSQINKNWFLVPPPPTSHIHHSPLALRISPIHAYYTNDFFAQLDNEEMVT